MPPCSQRLVCAALDDLSLVHHERIPIHSAGIDILPAYYEEFPKTHYPELYFDLPAAFQSVDQATDFPAMSRLLFEIENYRGRGRGGGAFYEARVYLKTPNVTGSEKFLR